MNFGILDEVYTIPYAYCQFPKSYIEIYNYETGTIVSNIILNNDKLQKAVGVFQPTPQIQVEKNINPSLITYFP